MLVRFGLLVVMLVCAIGALSYVLLKPKPADWSEAAKACVSDKYAGFWQDNGKYSFKMDLENSCERKVSCVIDVAINSATGSVKDHGVVVFAPRGEKPTAKTYAIPLQSPVGMAQAARNCRFV